MIEGARLPRDTRKHERDLARLRKLELVASDAVLAHARLHVDPKATLLASLERGELPDEGDLTHLFERKHMDLHEKFWWTAWLADPKRREVESEADHYPFIKSGPTSEPIDAMLFGSAPLLVDALPLAAYHVNWRGEAGAARMHPAEHTNAAAAFYASVAVAAEPPIEVFVRWYKQLYAHHFSLDASATLPAGDAMMAQYGYFLRLTRAFAMRASRFYANAHARRWAVVVYLE